MLIKELCIRCRIERYRASNCYDEELLKTIRTNTSYEWDEYNMCECWHKKNLNEWAFIDVRYDHPPKNCPYITEQAVCQY
jgi:hypothetical protein